MAKVTLDLETFKALASETRLAVLRSLDERRKTVSELARDLDLNKATVHEHLKLLTATDLVRKKDEGRKWIYYELTWQGQRILRPEATTSFALLLGLGAAAASGSVLMFGRTLGWWLSTRGTGPAADQGGAGGAEDVMPAAAPESDATSGSGTDTGTPSGTTTATSTTTDSATSTAEPGMAGVQADRASESLEMAAEDGGTLWDDGGLVALALLALAVVLLALAFVVRRRPGSRSAPVTPGRE